MDWWRDARFGMFIHWGLYAVPAGRWGEETGHAEWIRTTAQIPLEEYDGFVEQFDPTAYDPSEWARLAARAGMVYVVFTSKHHDGFALWDSDVSEFDVAATPHGRDLLGPLAEACAAEGLRICWYHSIMDWHHPDYLPRRAWETGRSADGADYERYVEYLHAQVSELLTRFGPIGIMWFDGEWESTWTHEHGVALYELCRELQPDVIVNNRVDKGRAGMAGLTVGTQYVGDYGTPEQEVPATGLPGVDWETCMTMNAHWGWNAADDQWKSTEDLIRLLVDTASKGGNLLLNVGPRADGSFPEQAVERLEGIGAWMERYGESIRGTQASPFAELPFGRCTTRAGEGETRLFLHVFQWPTDGELVVPYLGNEPLEARLLGEQEPREVFRRGNDVVIRVPARAPSEVCSPVVLRIEGEPLVFETPLIAALADDFVESVDVELVTRTPVEVRYTTDGADPGPESTLYRGPFRLFRSTELAARAFHEGRAVSDVARRSFREVAPWTAGEPGTTPGLWRERYSGDWNGLPAFDTLEASGSGVADDIELPEGTGEHEALRWTGTWTAPADGLYVFALESDDGSRLAIDGNLVVDNDGLHGPEEVRGVAPLAAGAHDLRVEWFNKRGGAALRLMVARPGGDFEPLALEDLHHAPR